MGYRIAGVGSSIWEYHSEPARLVSSCLDSVLELLQRIGEKQSPKFGDQGKLETVHLVQPSQSPPYPVPWEGIGGGDIESAVVAEEPLRQKLLMGRLEKGDLGAARWCHWVCRTTWPQPLGQATEQKCHQSVLTGGDPWQKLNDRGSLKVQGIF